MIVWLKINNIGAGDGRKQLGVEQMVIRGADDLDAGCERRREIKDKCKASNTVLDGKAQVVNSSKNKTVPI